MLTPQFNLSVLPGGHRDAKWGPSQSRQRCALKTLPSEFHLWIPQQSPLRDKDVKESKWAKESCWLCPRMGLFLVEAGMQSSCLCFVVFSFSLAHFWFVVQQLLADQIKNDGTPEKCSNLFFLSTSCFSPLCRLVQRVWSWDKEPLQSHIRRCEQGSWTGCKLVNLPVRKRVSVAVALHRSALTDAYVAGGLVCGHSRVGAVLFKGRGLSELES